MLLSVQDLGKNYTSIRFSNMHTETGENNLDKQSGHNKFAGNS